MFGRTIPVTWLLSITSVWAIVAMAGSLAFWRWYALRRPEPDEITKLTIGTAITMLAPLLLSVLVVLGFERSQMAASERR